MKNTTLNQLLIAIPFLLGTQIARSGDNNWQVSAGERAQMLKSAFVWTDPGNVSEKDMFQGPGKKYAVNQTVKCNFYDSYYLQLEGTGKTEKFWCVEDGKDPAKDAIKIKYDQKNGEVFAEVVASRLLWALGFYTDKAYPIKADCKNCPQDPWMYLNKLADYKQNENNGTSLGREARDNAAEYVITAQKRRQALNDQSMNKTGLPYYQHYEVALSESKFDGKAIYAKGALKAGVGLDELSLIDEAAGGSSRAQVDALKLVLAFVKHGDSKAENQRLACPPKDLISLDGKPQTCKHPAIVMQDIGSTIGNGSTSFVVAHGITASSKMAFTEWKNTPVWRDQSHCQARLADAANGTMTDPKVSEAGRKLLADLMSQLTDKQITDMFTAARADLRQGMPSKDINSWVELFKAKRAEIVNATCPQ